MPRGNTPLNGYWWSINFEGEEETNTTIKVTRVADPFEQRDVETIEKEKGI